MNALVVHEEGACMVSDWDYGYVGTLDRLSPRFVDRPDFDGLKDRLRWLEPLKVGTCSSCGQVGESVSMERFVEIRRKQGYKVETIGEGDMMRVRITG